MSTLQIETRDVDGVTVVDMIGRLDTSTSGDASDKLVAIVKSGVKAAVINLGQLEYVSSAGLRVILVMVKLLKSSKGRANICQATGVVKEVLETSGFNHLIDIYEDEEKSIDALRD